MNIQEKLNSIGSQSEWYFAKQDSDFDHAFYATEVFNNITTKKGADFQAYLNTNMPTGIEPNIRIFSVAQLFGLITKAKPYKRAGRYDDEDVTEVFLALKRVKNNPIEFNKIKTEQMLKLKVKAITDTRSVLDNYCINPLLFSIEVLYKLRSFGISSISIDQYWTYVMTSKSYDELDNVVCWLRTNPTTSPHVAQFKGDSRFVTLLSNNTKVLSFNNNRVSLNDVYIDDIRDMFTIQSNISKLDTLKLMSSNHNYLRYLNSYINLGFDFCSK